MRIDYPLFFRNKNNSYNEDIILRGMLGMRIVLTIAGVILNEVITYRQRKRIKELIKEVEELKARNERD